MAEGFSRMRFWSRLVLAMSLAIFPQLGSARENEQARTGSIEAGRFHLRYRIEGTGTPAIVIGSSIYYPRVFSENLRKHLRLVFLDHRGFAPSPGPVENAEFDLDKLIEDVERARRELELESVVVIGHSGHAFMALEYAKKYPDNVSHVVMIGIAPDFGTASDELMERYWHDSVSPERKAVLEENQRRLPDEKLAGLSPGEQFIKRYVRDGPRTWYDPRFDALPLWEGVELNMDMINYVWGTVFRDIDVTKGLDTFDRPVFLALGRYDFLVAPPSSWTPIRSKFRNLTVRVFERSGHTPQYEEAALFDEELLRWLSRYPKNEIDRS
jgi:proline iminopeptidase